METQPDKDARDLMKFLTKYLSKFQKNNYKIFSFTFICSSFFFLVFLAKKV